MMVNTNIVIICMREYESMRVHNDKLHYHLQTTIALCLLLYKIVTHGNRSKDVKHDERERGRDDEREEIKLSYNHYITL